MFDFKGMLKLVLVPVEKGLLKLVDENMSKMGKEFLKQGAAQLVDDNYDKVLGGLHGKVRALIDKIDGEANLPPLPAGEAAPATEEPAAPQAAPVGM